MQPFHCFCQAYQWVTPRLVSFQFLHISKCHFTARKWTLCVRTSHCCWQCRRKFFFCIFSPLSASRAVPLFAFRQPPSICIRPLKEFCGGCLPLFSLRGLDCSMPRAAERESRSHLSLSAQLPVPDDGLFSLMGIPEG